MHFFPCILDAAFRQNFVLVEESSPKLQYYYSCQNSVNKSRWCLACSGVPGSLRSQGRETTENCFAFTAVLEATFFSLAEHAIFLNDETRGSLDHVYYIQQGVPRTLFWRENSNFLEIWILALLSWFEFSRQK